MNADKIVQIKDWLGSSIFMKLFQKQQTKSSPPRRTKVKNDRYKPCSECYGSTIKEQKCLLIQKTFDQVNGKITAVSKTLNISRATADEWHRQGILNKKYIGSKVYYSTKEIEKRMEDSI